MLNIVPVDFTEVKTVSATVAEKPSDAVSSFMSGTVFMPLCQGNSTCLNR